MASINGIQVKEYIQYLADEGQLSVEKIGSGNWYWCFGSDGKKKREAQANQLKKEHQKLHGSCEETEQALTTEKAKRDKEEGPEEDGEKEERTTLVGRKVELEQDVQRLQAEEAAWMGSSSSGPGGVQRKKEEAEMWKQETMMWTDNIYILEEYLKKLAGGDRETVEAVQRECYGEEYMEGEGLRELE